MSLRQQLEMVLAAEARARLEHLRHAVRAALAECHREEVVRVIDHEMRPPWIPTNVAHLFMNRDER